MSINMDFFVSGDWIQKFFDPKRPKIKISFLMPFTFNTVELCVATINEKPWTCAREVCRALGYNKKTPDIVKAFRSQENYAQKYQMSGFTVAGNLWIGRRIRKNTIFTSMRKDV